MKHFSKSQGSKALGRIIFKAYWCYNVCTCESSFSEPETSFDVSWNSPHEHAFELKVLNVVFIKFVVLIEFVASQSAFVLKATGRLISLGKLSQSSFLDLLEWFLIFFEEEVWVFRNWRKDWGLQWKDFQMSFRNKWQVKNDEIGVVSRCWPWSSLCSPASAQPFGTQERPLGTHALPSSSLWELAFRQLPIKFQHTCVWLTSSCKGKYNTNYK